LEAANATHPEQPDQISILALFFAPPPPPVALLLATPWADGRWKRQLVRNLQVPPSRRVDEPIGFRFDVH